MIHKPYVREISRTGWWLQQPRYIRYMIRESSSLFIYLYGLLLVYGVKQLSTGPEAWAGFLHFLGHPVVALFLVIVLVFSLYHSFTWFKLFPQTMPILIGEKFLPGRVLVVLQFSAWAVISITVMVVAGAF